jgi:hypothetical protein
MGVRADSKIKRKNFKGASPSFVRFHAQIASKTFNYIQPAGKDKLWH